MLLNPRVKTLLLKLAVASAAIVAAVVLFRWGLLPGLVSVFGLEPDTVTIFRRAGVLCSVVLAYFAYVRFYEQRQASELRIVPLAMTAGALGGAGVIGLVSLFLFSIGAYEMHVYRGLDPALLGVACFILVAATIEEFVFRGVLFQAFEHAWGTIPALWAQSLFFSVLHIANLDSNAGVMTMIVSVFSGTLIGAFWTLVFIQTRNLWVVSLNHAAWNFAIVLTGLPLSGLDDWRVVAPLESTYQGSVWLTGGVVGPEDSVITILLVAIIVVGMVLRARKHNHMLNAAAL